MMRNADFGPAVVPYERDYGAVNMRKAEKQESRLEAESIAHGAERVVD